MPQTKEDVKTRVMREVSRIPSGSVSTYKEIAQKAKTGPRAVGQILKKNWDSKVPCHRIIRSDGTLGGYHGSHTRQKEKLLKSEGVEISKGKISLSKYDNTRN
ncbi:MGMT family protein [Candidatus Undinarchaeota archaeon]